MFVHSGLLQNLTSLNMWSSDDETDAGLTNVGAITTLTDLELVFSNNLTVVGITQLAAGRLAENLESLCLADSSRLTEWTEPSDSHKFRR